MSTIKLIHMYASPWAERVRWALNYKGVPYEKQTYQPGVDEEAVKKLTGQAQVPVLLVNGTVIPDSTAILNWLEEYKPRPALMPTSAKDRAQVMMWEELMDGVLGPQARMLIIGHFLRSSEPELQQGGRYFAQKYQLSIGHDSPAAPEPYLALRPRRGGRIRARVKSPSERVRAPPSPKARDSRPPRQCSRGPRANRESAHPPVLSVVAVKLTVRIFAPRT
jgi:glutathione S-transferase